MGLMGTLIAVVAATADDDWQHYELLEKVHQSNLSQANLLLRHTACQLAQGFRLLGIAYLLLRLPLFCRLHLAKTTMVMITIATSRLAAITARAMTIWYRGMVMCLATGICRGDTP
jgi:hypothetical protein